MRAGDYRINSRRCLNRRRPCRPSWRPMASPPPWRRVPCRALSARGIVGEVEAERRHRNEIGAHGPEVGPLRRLRLAALNADPVIGLAACIETILDVELLRIALALRRGHHALHGIGLAVGIVDVQHHALRPSRLQELAHEFGAVLHRRLPSRLAALGARLGVIGDEAHGDRGNAEQHALDGAGHRAGIVDVVGKILAAIDAGQDQVRRLVLEQEADAHDDAVGGRSLHRVAALIELAHAQGLGERQRMRGARLVGLRRHHPDILGDAGGDVLENVEARGLDAVVVGDQNPHIRLSRHPPVVMPGRRPGHPGATIFEQAALDPVKPGNDVMCCGFINSLSRFW